MLGNNEMVKILHADNLVTDEHHQTPVQLYYGKLDEITLIFTLLFMNFVLYINKGLVI